MQLRYTSFQILKIKITILKLQLQIQEGNQLEELVCSFHGYRVSHYRQKFPKFLFPILTQVLNFSLVSICLPPAAPPRPPEKPVLMTVEPSRAVCMGLSQQDREIYPNFLALPASTQSLMLQVFLVSPYNTTLAIKLWLCQSMQCTNQLQESVQS